MLRPSSAVLLAASLALPIAAATPLEEVTVTARRRAEDLRSVPLAISVVDARRLERTGTTDLQRLSELVPALHYSSSNPRNTAYTIRGLGSNTLAVSAANDGMEPGVGFYVDEVYQARPSSAAFDLIDIERIEVLRGPQGTLFGKNTTAGAIHVISRPPAFEPALDAQLSYGTLGLMQAKVSVTGPLQGSLAGRLSAQVTRRDGIIRNVRTGEDLNAVDSLALRGQILLRRDETSTLRLIGDMAALDSACCTQVYVRVGQSRRSPSRQFPALAAGIGYAPPSLGYGDRLTDIDAPLGIDTRQGGLTLIADASAASGRLTSVSAWRYWEWDVANDRDYTGIPIQRVQRIPSRQDQYSQEFRYTSSRDGRLEQVLGLYAFAQRITARPESVYGPEGAYWLLTPSSFKVPIPRDLLDGYGQIGLSRFRTQSYAAFGEVGWRASDRLRATLGVRYTYEDKSGVYSTTVGGGPDLSGLPAATAAELVRARLTILRPQSYRAAHSGGNLSGRMTLSWQQSDRALWYASHARGFKSGGLNMSGLPLDAADRPALATAVIADERNTTTEVGFKHASASGAVRLDLALFRTVVEDYQANVVSSLETAALRSYPSNIPEVRVEGLEADLVATVASGLTLRLSAAYTDARNTDYPSGPCPLELQTATTAACDLTGKPLPGAARWSGSLGVEHLRPVGGGELVAGLESSVRSGYNADTAASRYTWIGGHALVRLSVGYRRTTGWGIELFASNLLDRRHLTALTVQTGNSGLIVGQPGEPRIIGVRLGFRR